MSLHRWRWSASCRRAPAGRRAPRPGDRARAPRAPTARRGRAAPTRCCRSCWKIPIRRWCPRRPMEMALLLPLEEGDALTGPRYVRSLWNEVGGDDARAGMIAGLLQLGDERLAPLRRWRVGELESRGAETLALARPGRSRPQRADCAGFCLLVGSTRSGTPGPPPSDGGRDAGARRKARGGEWRSRSSSAIFPVADAPQSAPAGTRSASCAAASSARRCGRGWFAPPDRKRLHASCRTSSVTGGWTKRPTASLSRLLLGSGWLPARTTTGTAPARIELVPAWPEEPEQETLLEWGIFNPLGPTINTLRLTPRRVPAPSFTRSTIRAAAYRASWLCQLEDVVRCGRPCGRHAGTWRPTAPTASGCSARCRTTSTCLLRRSSIGAPWPRRWRRRQLGGAGGEDAVERSARHASTPAAGADPPGSAAQEIEPRGTGGPGREEASRESDPGGIPRRDAGRPGLEGYVRWLDVAAITRQWRAMRSRKSRLPGSASVPPPDQGETG